MSVNQPRSADRGMDELTADECRTLLSVTSVGRLGITSGALPVVLPVNFALTDHGIVFRTAAGSKLDAAVTNQVVCFEIDGSDPIGHQGWSVVVTGTARVLHGPARDRAASLPLPHWVDDEADHFVAIPLEQVSGRRLRHAAGGSAGGPVARSRDDGGSRLL